MANNYYVNDFKGFEKEVTHVIIVITNLGFDLALKEAKKGELRLHSVI